MQDHGNSVLLQAMGWREQEAGWPASRWENLGPNAVCSASDRPEGDFAIAGVGLRRTSGPGTKLTEFVGRQGRGNEATQ